MVGRPFKAGSDERRKQERPKPPARGIEEVVASARLKAAKRLEKLVVNRDDAIALQAIHELNAWGGGKTNDAD